MCVFAIDIFPLNGIIYLGKELTIQTIFKEVFTIKKLLSVLLIFTITFSCFAFRVCAADATVSDLNPYAAIYAETDTDALFQLRATYLLDHEDGQSAIEAIDERLHQLGVEKITSSDVAHLFNNLSSENQPRYTPVSTPGTTWYSQRLINVYNGKEYEVQIITGQMANPQATNSPLYDYIPGIVKEYTGWQVGLTNALYVAAPDIIVSAGSIYAPAVGSVFSAGLTLYDILMAYQEGLTPTSTLDNAAYSFDIILISTMKFAFIKASGAVDTGNQILGYAGTEVKCAVKINIPRVSENLVPYYESVEYADTITSYGFDNYAIRAIASQNFWNYKLGYTELDQYYLIHKIPFTLMNSIYYADVPYTHP